MDIVWAGIAVGALYAIVAIIYNVVLAQTGIFNFAAAQPLMIGAFVAYAGIVEHDWPAWLTVVVGAVAGAVVSLLIERIAVRPLRDVGFSVLVTTVGAAVVIQGIAIQVWGADPKSVPFPGTRTSFELFGGVLQPIDAWLIVIAIVLAFAMHFASRRTPWGLAGRATTENEDAASLRGVNVRRVVTYAFLVSGAIAGAIGPLAAGRSYADVTLGTNMVVYAFIALAIGGFGSYIGCLFGGLITGVVQAEVARYYDSNYSLLILLGVVLVILLVRPSGLMGERALRSV
jgi:branched-chain amino acid transport system permease protein